MNQRPDPDELLKRLQGEEPVRGRLKIFLGYAAGVGKTYAMLEAAHQRLRQGVDVVIGYVETHNRPDTEELVQGLEILPRRQVEYKDIKLPELNTDAVLQRHPGLVLVDEFAHSNAPGSRHPKRYLDVEDILDAGIDVYTTLNVQHLESLNDVVAQVTGVVVHETVPDRVLDEASEIEVIDLPPDELLTRLEEGKVYIPEQAKRAIQKFFRKGNLSALREMSLRRAAERVDTQMRNYMRTRAISGPWAATERLLVCISPSPLSEKLVRTTRRLSDELGAEWFAVYVNVTSKPDLNPVNAERIARNLQLAEELGARTRTLTGHSIPDEVLKYAKKHNVTKIVVGKPIHPRWMELFRGSIVDQLIYASGDIDVYVINEQSEKSPAKLPETWHPHQPFWRYLAAMGIVALTTFIGYFVHKNLEPVNLVMLYLVGTMIASVYLGKGPALLTSILGVLAFDYFLVPPYLTFAVSDTQYFITFIGLFLISLVVSTLTIRTKAQAEAAIQREAHTSALYKLGKDLTSATDLTQVANIIITNISQVLGRDVAIFLPENGKLKVFASSPGYSPDANEIAVATWGFEHDQPAGLGTDTLPAATIRCQPLKTAHGQIGVLGIHPQEGSKLLSTEQRQTFNAFANQAALAVERASLAEQARQAELLQATEKLQTALLNSISHDLRTPLVSITGALSSLREESLVINQEDKNSLLETAYSEAERLNRLVGNLLNMTRLEANAIHLKLEPGDVQDTIGAALDQLEERLGKKPIVVTVPDDLPLVTMDFALFGQALVNVIDNAIKYSPKDSQIEIDVSQNDKEISIKISDRGIGIPQEDLDKVFDKFYRVSRPESVNGTGLGLAISKGIIEALHGTIKASNRSGGGTAITISLPKGVPK
jgi:two-component system sensor histidine kinase KdpD